MATLDLSKLSFEELQNLPTDDAPVTPRAQPVDTGLHPAHNQIEMLDPSEIKMPDRTGSLSPEEIAKTAQYRAQQEAYSLQQVGTPLNREQYKKLVSDSYDQVFKLNTPRTPEEELKYKQEYFSTIKSQQDIQKQQQELEQQKRGKLLDATQALDLSAAESSFSALDQLARVHKENVMASRPGFGTPWKKAKVETEPGSGKWVEINKIGAQGNADWSPEGAAYIGLSEGSLPLFAKGVANTVGNPSESDMKSVRAMMFNPIDSMETVSQKTKLFKEKIINSQKAKLASLEAAGFDVEGLKKITANLEASLKHPNQIPVDAPAEANLVEHYDDQLKRLTTPHQ